MSISERKMQIVIDNYFKSECDVNTSIRQAFEKGFRIGVKKGQSADRPHGKWILTESGRWYKCSVCNEEGVENPDYYLDEPIFTDYCPNCGAIMENIKRIK